MSLRSYLSPYDKLQPSSVNLPPDALGTHFVALVLCFLLFALCHLICGVNGTAKFDCSKS